jgi:hypothetical protein
MLSEQPPLVQKKLRGWFWPLLFAPALFSAVGTTLIALVIKGHGPSNWGIIEGQEQSSWVILWNILAALPLNGICSAICAVHLSRTRTGEAKPAWLVLGTLGFFALNGVLAFGGCTAGVLSTLKH